MDNITSTSSIPQPSSARHVGESKASSAAILAKDPVDAAAGDAPAGSAVSAAAVAANVERDKAKSLSALSSVAESIEEAVALLNDTLGRHQTSALIRRDEELNRYIVTIRDKESGEIVREIPDEALIKFARNLKEMKGILFDETT